MWVAWSLLDDTHYGTTTCRKPYRPMGLTAFASERDAVVERGVPVTDRPWGAHASGGTSFTRPHPRGRRRGLSLPELTTPWGHGAVGRTGWRGWETEQWPPRCPGRTPAAGGGGHSAWGQRRNFWIQAGSVRILPLARTGCANSVHRDPPPHSEDHGPRPGAQRQSATPLGTMTMT